MMSGEVASLSPAIAFRIFPIAHAYNMWGILHRCTTAALKGTGDKTSPDLFQWLAAADVRHYNPLITACLERLREQQSAAAADGAGVGAGEKSRTGSKATPAALDLAYARCSAICSSVTRSIVCCSRV